MARAERAVRQRSERYGVQIVQVERVNLPIVTSLFASSVS